MSFTAGASVARNAVWEAAGWWMRAVAFATRALTLRPRAVPLLPRVLAAGRTLSVWQPPSTGVAPSPSNSGPASQFTPEEAERLAGLSEHEGPPRSSSQYTIRELADALVLGHAAEVTVLDIRPVPGKPAVEWLLFATARSHSHMRTLARSITSTLKSAGVQIFGRPPMVEGANAEDWMLVDAGKSVVSILTADCRRSLKLEEHWQELGAVTALQMPPAVSARAAAAAAAAASELTGRDFTEEVAGDEIYRDDVPDMAAEYELVSSRGRAGPAERTGLVGELIAADDDGWEYSEYEMEYYEATVLDNPTAGGEAGRGAGGRGGGAPGDPDGAEYESGSADDDGDAHALEAGDDEYDGYSDGDSGYYEYDGEYAEYGDGYDDRYEEYYYDDGQGDSGAAEEAGGEETGGPSRKGDAPPKVG